MPASPRETVLCRYHYDPLDRQAGCMPYEQAGIQSFYCKSRLATEIQGTVRCSIFQHDDQLLAQQQSQSGKVDATLLATDQQRSVLNALDTTGPHPLAYTPYGHRPLGNGLLSLLGFNGERPDPVTGHYHLGNGYRQFNPVLMRFNNPDSWSPFGEGGLNAYGYCGGEPVKRNDPTGHSVLLSRIFMGITGVGGVGSMASLFIQDEDTASALAYGSLALIGVGAIGLLGPMARNSIGRRLNQRRGNLPPPRYETLSPRNSLTAMSEPPPTYQQAMEMQNLGARHLPDTTRLPSPYPSGQLVNNHMYLPSTIPGVGARQPTSIPPRYPESGSVSARTSLLTNYTPKTPPDGQTLNVHNWRQLQ